MGPAQMRAAQSQARTTAEQELGRLAVRKGGASAWTTQMLEKYYGTSGEPNPKARKILAWLGQNARRIDARFEQDLKNGLMDFTGAGKISWDKLPAVFAFYMGSLYLGEMEARDHGLPRIKILKLDSSELGGSPFYGQADPQGFAIELQFNQRGGITLSEETAFVAAFHCGLHETGHALPAVLFGPQYYSYSEILPSMAGLLHAPGLKASDAMRDGTGFLQRMAIRDTLHTLREGERRGADADWMLEKESGQDFLASLVARWMLNYFGGIRQAAGALKMDMQHQRVRMQEGFLVGVLLDERLKRMRKYEAAPAGKKAAVKAEWDWFAAGFLTESFYPPDEKTREGLKRKFMEVFGKLTLEKMSESAYLEKFRKAMDAAFGRAEDRAPEGYVSLPKGPIRRTDAG